MSSPLEQTTKELNEARSVIDKLGETFDSFQVHSSSILSLADQWRNLQSNFPAIDDLLVNRLKELEAKEKENVEALSKLQKRLDLGEKSLSERISAVEVKEKDLKECYEVMELEKRDIGERRKAIESMEGRLMEELDRISALDEREKEIDRRCEEVELEKVRVRVLSEEVESEKVRVRVLSEEVELEKVRVGELSVELGRKEKEIKECGEALEAKEEELKERIREVELKEVEMRMRCGALGMKEERLRVKEKELDEVYEALELREKEMNEELKLLVSREKLINEAKIVVEAKDKEVEKRREALELKEKDMNELGKVLAAKETGVNELRKVLKLKEKVANDVCQAEVPKEKRYDVACEAMDSKQTQSSETSSVNVMSAIHSLCINMDAQGVKSYLLGNVKKQNELKEKILEALGCAPDPAKLVLDVCRSFHKTNSDQVYGDASITSCIFLLEQFMNLSSSITPTVKDDARDLATIWRSGLGRCPADNFGFFLFIAAYKLSSIFSTCDLISRLSKLLAGFNAYRPEQTVHLCRALGLAEMIPGHVRSLIEEHKWLIAVKYVCVFKLQSSFPPVPLLETYLEQAKKRVQEKLSEWTLKAKLAAIHKEISFLWEAVNCISNFKLESEYPTGPLRSCIKQLEVQHVALKLSRKRGPSSRPSVVPLKHREKRPRVGTS